MKQPKMNYGILFLLIITSGYSTAQEVKKKLIFDLTDTSEVTYDLASWPNEIDSIISVYTSCNNDQEVEVFFDVEKKQIAYEQKVVNGYCIKQQYWRNGGLKSRIILGRTEGDNYYGTIKEEAFYCENGQLIVLDIRSPLPEDKDQWPKFHYIKYHCNGKKHVEFTRLGNYPEGLFRSWYENGNLESELFYKDEKWDGEQKYYNTDGKLEQIQIYKDGELMKSTNY
jgi:hypothetical protein